MNAHRSAGRPFPELPLATVNKLVKAAVPEGISVAGESRPIFAQAASVFIMYVAATARDNAANQNRQNVSGKDILFALEELEFPEFAEDVEAALAAYKSDLLARKAVKGGAHAREQERDDSGDGGVDAVMSEADGEPEPESE